MRKPHVAGSLCLATVLTSLFAFVTEAQACDTEPCTNNVEITSVKVAGTNTNLISAPIGYSALYEGKNLVAPDAINNGGTGTFNTINDKNGMFYGSPGVGNYAPLADGMAGWILLGEETAAWSWRKWNWEYAFTPAAIAGETISESSNWFSAKGFGGSHDSGESGTWAFNLPANLLSIMAGYPAIADLFDGHLFDQFSLVLFGDTIEKTKCVKKSRWGVCTEWKTDQTTPYIAYDFTAEDLGLTVSPDPIFNFSGIWESCFDVTRIALYVRDPATNNVPEPGSLALFGLCAIGLVLAGRRRKLAGKK